MSPTTNEPKLEAITFLLRTSSRKASKDCLYSKQNEYSRPWNEIVTVLVRQSYKKTQPCNTVP